MPAYQPEGIDDAFATHAADDAVDPAQSPASASAEPVRLPALGARGWLRWAWRQLTSMRVALLLLLALAVAALPGALLPQRAQDVATVEQYIEDNPVTGPWMDRLQLFDVYSSTWFSAVYLLLFASLVGCIVPRCLVHARALRASPPRVPRRFDRFRDTAELTTTQSAADVERTALAALRGPVPLLPRFRVVATEPRPGVREISAERGYLRETGNLLFHLALLALLVSVATGQLLHYRAQAIVVEGRGFANAEIDYATFEHGPWFDPSSLVPFSLTLDRFRSEFDPLTLASRDFTAEVTLREPGRDERPETIKVNHPLAVGGASVYLQGNGFAPDVQVRDADGNLAFAGPVPFLAQDELYTSQGVVKVPDVTSGDQVALVGYLLPTGREEAPGLWRSVHPQPLDPVLVLSVWRGDLGLDEGVPQNVYRLREDDMTQVVDDDGAPLTLVVRPGETVDLPDGLGTLTFGELPRFIAVDLRHDPALGATLVSALLALAGLCVSLFTPRRRVWLRVTEDGGRTVVAAAALARSDDAGLAGELDRVMAAIDPAATSAADEPDSAAPTDAALEGER